MDYSKLIKELRKKLIVSQAELAKILGCSFASVNRWENGLHEPTYKMKQKIAPTVKLIKSKSRKFRIQTEMVPSIFLMLLIC